MTLISSILTIVAEFGSVFIDWYKERKTLGYLEERAKIRKEKRELLEQIERATGDEKERLIEEYLDKFICNR